MSGLINSSKNCFEYEYEGYKLTGEYDFEEGFVGDNVDESYDPICSVYLIFINGSKENAYELVSPAVIHWIEEQLAKN